MDGDYVGKPHGDVGELFGDYFLGFAAKLFSFFLIGLYTNLISQPVDVRILVVSAVGAVGRETFGSKNIFKNVGIVVGADPTRVSELKISARRIGKRGGQFQRAKF
jgi:hypothetical protein